MIRYIITISAAISLSIASIYDVGDIVSDSHQNVTKSTCYAGNDYGVGDSWKLADWNGATNGGHYNVIFLEMTATW
jgi:hypothetical protein